MRPPRLPSPAMTVALIALFVALGGVGYAAVKVNGKDIKNRSVAREKVKRNTLTGNEIKESRLGIVPSAKKATTAGTAGSAATASVAARATTAGDSDTVGGVRFRSFRYHSAGADPDHALFTLDGLQVRVECSSIAGLLVRYASLAGPARMSASQVVHIVADTAQAADVAMPDSTPVFLPLATHTAIGTAIYTRPDRTITITYRQDENVNVPPCEYQGIAQSAPVR